MSQTQDPKTFQDFIEERKTLKILTGHNICRNNGEILLKQKLYIAVILLGFSYVLLMAVTSFVLTMDDKPVFYQSFHLILLAVCAWTALFTRVWHDQSIVEAMRSLREGVFTYRGEVRFEEHAAMKTRNVRLIRLVNGAFFHVIVFRIVFNLTIQPGLKYLLTSEDTSAKPVNPFLPEPIYMPFDTRTYHGYAAGFLINALFVSYLCFVVISQVELYISLLLQVKVQLEILNHSLINIQKRAMSRMVNSTFSGIEDMENSVEYQICMTQCLRSNILHYNAILRIFKITRGYTGAIFLYIIVVPAFALAAMGLQILENPDRYVLGNLAITFGSEIFFTACFCWFGELATNEASLVFHSLYAMPWTSCNRSFNLMVLILMANTRVPITIKASIFNFKARMETFGDILIKVYQLMNVLRGQQNVGRE